MSTVINFRIDEQLKNQLESLSKQRGVKPSVILREIVKQYLEDSFPKPKKEEIVLEVLEVIEVTDLEPLPNYNPYWRLINLDEQMQLISGITYAEHMLRFERENLYNYSNNPY